MKESKVEKHVRLFLLNKGWTTRTKEKSPGEHGVDIKMFHPRYRKTLWIEVKGGSGKNPTQEKHNAFYTVLGQILSRMDREGNRPNKARIYAIAIPSSWVETFKKKIKKMRYVWKLLRLPVYEVQPNGKVIKRAYSFFLRGDR